MQNKPLVSVLIASYNYEAYLPTCIDSALNQTYSQVEVIVNDNGSADNSRAIMDSYGGRITPCYQENKGPMGSYNTGFAASHGEIICMLDSDDYFFPDKISRVVDIFRTYPDIGWFFHNHKIVDEKGTVTGMTPLKKTGKLDVKNYIKRTGIMPVGGTADSGLCFSRSLFQTMYPLPEESTLSVTDRYLKAVACASTKGFFDEQPQGALRVHGRNLASGLEGKEKISSIIRTTISNAYWLQKNWPFLGRFSNKIYAQGRAQAHKFNDIDQYHKKLMQEYLSLASFQDRLEIKLFELYYRFIWTPG